MPVFALLALVAYSVSLALIIPGLLQKQQLAANGDFICDYRLNLPCFCAGSTDIPRRRGGQNLSLLNVGSLVSLMICTVMTIVASRNRGWLLLPIVYAFALINSGLRHIRA